MDEAHDEKYQIPILDDLEALESERFHGVWGSSSLVAHDAHSSSSSRDTTQRQGGDAVQPSPLLSSPTPKNTSFSLPILRAVEVVPPVHHVDYLSALIHSDPRVAFDTLHLGLMEYISTMPSSPVRPKGERKRQRPTAFENDDTTMKKSSLLDRTSPTSANGAHGVSGDDLSFPSERTIERLGYPLFEEDERNTSPLVSLTSATVKRNATSDVVVEVLPLHQMVSERPPFKVNFEEVEKVLQATKKKDIEALVGASFLNFF